MRLAFAALVALGCGGRSQIEIGPVPARQTTGPLVGPLCKDAECACRTGDEDAGIPANGKKRFEIKVGPSPQEAWVTLPGHLLYKTSQHATSCFYVDYAPGQHPVELRASDPNGVVAAMTISELGTKTKSWYDTFGFSCGSGGACSFEQLDDIEAEYRQVKRNLHDACGSTKVKSISIDHGKAPDRSHPNELLVRLTLDVYKFDPWKLHGDTTCGEGGGPPPADHENE